MNALEKMVKEVQAKVDSTDSADRMLFVVIGLIVIILSPIIVFMAMVVIRTTTGIRLPGTGDRNDGWCCAAPRSIVETVNDCIDRGPNYCRTYMVQQRTTQLCDAWTQDDLYDGGACADPPAFKSHWWVK